jgi:2-C-methyl-D-erythritol 4-phosphate cytidylyltransferase
VERLAPFAAEVVVAVPVGAEARARELAPEALVIAGGATRQATVAALLGRTDCRWVVVHDVARPFLAADVLARVVAGARTSGAATASLALRDTVVAVDSGETVDRDRLRAIQTPQAFARELLLEAHSDAAEAGVSATDDTGLVRRLGRDVTLVEGSPWLLKITTPEDLRLAAGLAGAWRDA